MKVLDLEFIRNKKRWKYFLYKLSFYMILLSTAIFFGAVLFALIEGLVKYRLWKLVGVAALGVFVFFIIFHYTCEEFD